MSRILIRHGTDNIENRDVSKFVVLYLGSDERYSKKLVKPKEAIKEVSRFRVKGYITAPDPNTNLNAARANVSLAYE